MEWSHIILTAGKSSRMGFPKALITVGDSRMIVKKIEAGRLGGASQTLVVTGQHEARIRRVIKADDSTGDIIFVRNPCPASDQTRSVKLALTQIPSGQPVLMDLIDHPPPAPAVMKRLIPDTEHSNRIRIPTYKKRRGHPPWFPGWFTKEIMNLEPDKGINSLYDRFNDQILEVPVEDPRILLDLDTPEDLVEWRKN